MRPNVHPPRVCRGSRRRIRRIRLRGNASPALLWLIVWAAVVLVILVARLLHARR